MGRQAGRQAGWLSCEEVDILLQWLQYMTLSHHVFRNITGNLANMPHIFHFTGSNVEWMCHLSIWFSRKEYCSYFDFPISFLYLTGDGERMSPFHLIKLRGLVFYFVWFFFPSEGWQAAYVLLKSPHLFRHWWLLWLCGYQAAYINQGMIAICHPVQLYIITSINKLPESFLGEKQS